MVVIVITVLLFNVMFDVLQHLQKGGVSNREICALKGNPLQIGSLFNKG